MTATSDAHVTDSVEAAVAALEQLAASLRHGGFAEGAAAYQRMADVLVAQRLFHESDDGADPLVVRFDHLGGLARQVFELLEPYTSAMRRLAAFAPARADASTVAAIHAQLERRGRRGATASLLARAAHLPPDTAEQVLAGLVAEGTVVRRDAGDVSSYRLAIPPGRTR